ncbi:uncharacterized protein LOC119895776 isoform X1 [Micropterus salmoides]|uniref:uncharacterized protein LOC119895776 isoform X1 n=1 Tax=Micropterus salmoides TaxID=27706 RepID=UPI0018EC9CBD|nr:uncharacterized protein LOC119895776 isoform X1 [Micropterus salmoides]
MDRIKVAKKVALSKKYILCQMPAEWITLPVHTGLRLPPTRNSISVYTKKQSNSLTYEGFIVPPAPVKVPMSALQAPPREESFGKKYATLLEQIRAEEAEAEAQTKIISEHQKNRMAESAASSKPGKGVVKEEPSNTPCCEYTADESKQQMKEVIASESQNKPQHLNWSLQRTESNTDYLLPLEILDRRERLLPPPKGETEDFVYCFEPWESTVDVDSLYS